MSDECECSKLDRQLKIQELAKLKRENALGYKPYIIQVIAIIVAVATLFDNLLDGK